MTHSLPRRFARRQGLKLLALGAVLLSLGVCPIRVKGARHRSQVEITPNPKHMDPLCDGLIKSFVKQVIKAITRNVEIAIRAGLETNAKQIASEIDRVLQRFIGRTNSSLADSNYRLRLLDDPRELTFDPKLNVIKYRLRIECFSGDSGINVLITLPLPE